MSNLFSSLGCNLSGSYDEYLRLARIDLATLERQQIDELRRSEEAEAEARQASLSRDNLQRLYAATQRDLDRLNVEVVAGQSRNGRMNVRNQLLQEQLAVAQTRLQGLQGSLPSRREDLERDVRILQDDIQSRIRSADIYNRQPLPE